MAAVHRVLLKPMEVHAANADRIIKACLCLHNFRIAHGLLQDLAEEWRQEVDPLPQAELGSVGNCGNYSSQMYSGLDSSCLGHRSTFEVWMEMLEKAENSLEIASYYWWLRDQESEYSMAGKGNGLFQAIVDCAKRGVKVKIAQMEPTERLHQANTRYLSENAEVRSVDMASLVGSGILHTKMWIVDGKHVYLGSANMCWRSLTEIKELGVLYSNCPELAEDVGKIFSAYWFLGSDQAKTMKPSEWQSFFPETTLNSVNYAKCALTGSAPAQIYFSSAPVAINSTGRENDLDAILKLFTDAENYVRVSVMDYLPLATSIGGAGNSYYWPAIDNAIRAAAYRGVQVEMLISHWEHSPKEMIACLKSLLHFSQIIQNKGGIFVRLFEIPKLSGQEHIDYIRVNHTKYAMTDKAAYMGTSNWTGNNFTCTSGIGCVFKPAEKTETPVIIQQLGEVFARDWNSTYAKVLSL
uniref:PLD phosphodiesterase domain-containing protein n=1 Tax=Ditylenchus dipsaci TaxID=166011 RepID=A0A915DMM6_9BILA